LASYEFTLELSRDIIDSEAEIIRSICGDATIKAIPTGIDTGYTGTLVEFDRAAESLEKAIESAMHDIETVPDLHATGITIPAPERDESSAEGTDSADSSAVAEPTVTESSADVAPGAETAKKQSAKKASTRKTSAGKSTTRKTTVGKESDSGGENAAS
jgi:hypothetical protein